MNCGAGPAREAPFSGQEGFSVPALFLTPATEPGAEHSQPAPGRGVPVSGAAGGGGGGEARGGGGGRRARGNRASLVAPHSPGGRRRRAASPVPGAGNPSPHPPPPYRLLLGAPGETNWLETQTLLSSGLWKALHRGPSSLYILNRGKQNPVKSKRMGMDRPPARLRRPLIGGDGSQRRKSSLSRMIG